MYPVFLVAQLSVTQLSVAKLLWNPIIFSMRFSIQDMLKEGACSAIVLIVHLVNPIGHKLKIQMDVFFTSITYHQLILDKDWYLSLFVI